MFDFNLFTDDIIETITAKEVVIPNFYLVQNIRPQDFTVRASHALTDIPQRHSMKQISYLKAW